MARTSKTQPTGTDLLVHKDTDPATTHLVAALAGQLGKLAVMPCEYDGKAATLVALFHAQGFAPVAILIDPQRDAARINIPGCTSILGGRPVEPAQETLHTGLYL